MQSLNTFQQSTNGRPSQPRPTQEPRPTLDLPALQSASRVLHEQYLKDAQAVPELSDMLTIRMLCHPFFPCSSVFKSCSHYTIFGIIQRISGRLSRPLSQETVSEHTG